MEDDEPGAVLVEVEDEMPEISLTISLEKNDVDDTNTEKIFNELIENLNSLLDEEILQRENFTEASFKNIFSE